MVRKLRDVMERLMMVDIIYAEPWHEKLSYYRNQFGLAQVRVAEEMGVVSSVLSDYEGGRRENPGIQELKKMVRAIMDAHEKELSKGEEK